MSPSLVFHRLILAGFAIAITLLTGCVGVGGTTVNLHTNELAPPKQPVQGRILLHNEARDQYPGSPAVGKALWTAFKAELAPISSNTPPKQKLVELAKNALEKAGYEVRVVTVQEARPLPEPVIHVKIEQFAYEMWGYWYPYVPIEGRTTLVFAIQASDGRQIDGKVLSAEGKESCWFGWCERALETAMAQSLTNIMNQFIDWTSESSLRASLVQATARQETRPTP